MGGMPEQGPGAPQQMKMNINRKDIIDAESEVCSCGSRVFTHGAILKKVPGFMVGAGTDTVMMPIEVFVCAKCGELAPSIKEDPMMENLLEGKKREETKSGIII